MANTLDLEQTEKLVAQLPPREQWNIIRTLRQYGFDQAREGSNHTIFSNGRATIPVPRHRQIASKTAMRIAKEVGVDWQQFKSKIS